MNNFRHYDHYFGTAKEACRAYNIHPETLHRWAKSGKIRYRTGPSGKSRRYEIVLNEPEKKRGEDNVEA
jgi:predicted site-specific integrase-resolvase